MNEKTLYLNEDSYWEEIEQTDLPARVKDTLKSAISAYRHDVCPSDIPNHEIALFQKHGVRDIVFMKEGKETYLEVSVAVPRDINKHRQLLYVRKAYPFSRNICIDEVQLPKDTANNPDPQPTP
jgi:hypothetical protein